MGPRAGTKEFIEGLKKRKFAKCQDVVVTAKGHELADLIDKTSFRQPFLVPSPEGLDLVVPPGSFTIRDVVDSVGKDRLVDVIDVQESSDFKMSMADFFNWFYQTEGNKIYNVLSLEISETRLSSTVVPPKPVRDLSLVNRCWPDESGHLSGEDCPEDDTRNKPEVLKFCLMSAGHSYTDFHIDFGGSSVWYHILWGEKIFYLIPPSDVNLDRYESWMESPDNLTEFLGDRCPGQVYQLRVTTGNTIVLPSGWIHAVYTPMDSLVFGGNFLHLHSVEMQIRIHEMEQRLATERRFQFPMFEKLHWYAAQLFLEQYQGDLDDQALPEFSHVESMRYLVQALARWYDKRRGSPYQAEYVPDNLTLPPRECCCGTSTGYWTVLPGALSAQGDSAGGKVDSITASSPKRNFDQRDSSATSSKQLHKYKKKPGKGLTAKKPNDNNLVGINEGDSSASDEGIDVAKCTEDEQ
uniref:JmjC domain-containing protein n=1 Tax=Macrostomum lignano TaxID=282301 RepID=A0A1I8FJR5_9PLAT